jgi:hypothetical protein
MELIYVNVNIRSIIYTIKSDWRISLIDTE